MPSPKGFYIRRCNDRKFVWGRRLYNRCWSRITMSYRKTNEEKIRYRVSSFRARYSPRFRTTKVPRKGSTEGSQLHVKKRRTSIQNAKKDALSSQVKKKIIILTLFFFIWECNKEAVDYRFFFFVSPMVYAVSDLALHENIIFVHFFLSIWYFYALSFFFSIKRVWVKKNNINFSNPGNMIIANILTNS